MQKFKVGICNKVGKYKLVPQPVMKIVVGIYIISRSLIHQPHQNEYKNTQMKNIKNVNKKYKN